LPPQIQKRRGRKNSLGRDRPKPHSNSKKIRIDRKLNTARTRRLANLPLAGKTEKTAFKFQVRRDVRNSFKPRKERGKFRTHQGRKKNKGRTRKSRSGKNTKTRSPGRERTRSGGVEKRPKTLQTGQNAPVRLKLRKTREKKDRSPNKKKGTENRGR